MYTLYAITPDGEILLGSGRATELGYLLSFAAGHPVALRRPDGTLIREYTAAEASRLLVA